MIQAKSKINDKIEALEQQLLTVKGTETEKYARIVGYYRAVKNWNKGKKEEYKFRVNYTNTAFDSDVNGMIKQTNVESQKPESKLSTDEIATYKFFFRTTCPNCPPVKALMNTLLIKGESINADESKGFTKAAKHDVFAAPTVIFLSKDGKEILRTSNPIEIKRLIAQKAIK